MSSAYVQLVKGYSACKWFISLKVLSKVLDNQVRSFKVCYIDTVVMPGWHFIANI